MIDAEWLKILACPYCVTRSEAAPEGQAKGLLALAGPAENPTALNCTQCGRIYKIEDGVPNLLVDEATLPEPESA